MQKDFCLGSEWLYYKIYTGVKTTDLILLEKLQPVILQLKKSCLLYTSPSPRDRQKSRMPSSA